MKSKQVTILIIIIIILIVASLTIGMGWYIYIPEKISKLVGAENPKISSNIPEVPAVQPEQAVVKAVRLKIGEKAAYKRNRYAEIKVSLTNLDNFEGDATIAGVLYYAQTDVGNSVLAIKNIKPKEVFNATIIVNTTKNWNAFEVRQI